MCLKEVRIPAQDSYLVKERKSFLTWPASHTILTCSHSLRPCLARANVRDRQDSYLLHSTKNFVALAAFDPVPDGTGFDAGKNIKLNQDKRSSLALTIFLDNYN